MLFPEGERSIDGAVKTFKKGAAILSHHLAAPIVPVALDGLYLLWPRNRPINWALLRPWRRARVAVRFGAPLPAPLLAATAASGRGDSLAEPSYAITTTRLRDTSRPCGARSGLDDSACPAAELSPSRPDARAGPLGQQRPLD